MIGIAGFSNENTEENLQESQKQGNEVQTQNDTKAGRKTTPIATDCHNIIFPKLQTSETGS